MLFTTVLQKDKRFAVPVGRKPHDFCRTLEAGPWKSPLKVSQHWIRVSPRHVTDVT